MSDRVDVGRLQAELDGDTVDAAVLIEQAPHGGLRLFRRARNDGREGFLHRRPGADQKDGSSFWQRRASGRPRSSTMTDTDQSGPVEGPNETDDSLTRRAFAERHGSNRSDEEGLTRPLPGPLVPLRWRLQRRRGPSPARRPCKRGRDRWSRL